MSHLISDLDVCRAAWLILRRHGDGAFDHAVERAFRLAEAGSAEGAAVWFRVAAACGRLEEGQVSDNPAYPNHAGVADDRIGVLGRVIWLGRNIGG